MDLDTVKHELYGLPREDFTAARDARAAKARAAGRRDDANVIRRLRKPTPAAWLANRLAREHPGEIRSLRDLGDALRAAGEARDGDALRRLAPRRSQLLGELVALATRLGEASGQRVTADTVRGLEETLRAALADPGLGERLAAGGLAEALTHSGFPILDPGPAPSVPARGSPPGPDREAADREAADREAADRAREAAEAAAARLAVAQEEADAADAAVSVLSERIRDLRDALARALEEEKAAVRSQARAHAALARAIEARNPVH